MREQEAGGQQILESVTRLKNITVSVKKGAQDMSESGGELVKKTHEFIKISNQVVEGMDKILNGAMRQIQVAVGNVDDMSRENNRNFNDLKSETEKFKVSTGNEKKTVLVVDEPTHLTAVKGMLERDHEIVTVASGKEALSLFYQGLVPNIIMLDPVMPDTDGSTYERIRQISGVHSIPIAIYTSSADPADKNHANEMGAADYIKKPCKQEELLARIGAILEAPRHS
jgi:CheY-like chemotaxis protein